MTTSVLAFCLLHLELLWLHLLHTFLEYIACVTYFLHVLRRLHMLHWMETLL